jgi:hypothetical protein
MTPQLALVRIEVLAHDAGLHPGLVRRLVSMGAVEPEAPDAAAQLARMSRLRRDLGVNWAGAILAGELLTRIDELMARVDELEARLSWTRIG